MRLDMIFSMRDIYINSSPNPLTKFTSSGRSNEVKDILPWNISQMIMGLLHGTFARDLSLENSADFYFYFLLALVHSVSYFFFLCWSPSLSLYMVFDSFSSNIDDVLSINPSANVFVFGDFNVHHNDWLTYFGGTDWPGELCYNFAISNDASQMLNFRMWILDCDFHSPAFLDVFPFCDTSICSTMAFPTLGNSDHVVVSVFIDFSSNLQLNVPFHHITYDYSRADWMVFVIIWEMFCGRISLILLLLLLLVNFVTGFRLELMYISLIENMSSLICLYGFQLLVMLP